jgi:hypothetical protein
MPRILRAQGGAAVSLFSTWKAERAERRTQIAAIEQDNYLRRLRNSCMTLTGVRHTGPGCDDALSPHEVKAVLRSALAALAACKPKEGV